MVTRGQSSGAVDVTQLQVDLSRSRDEAHRMVPIQPRGQCGHERKQRTAHGQLEHQTQRRQRGDSARVGGGVSMAHATQDKSPARGVGASEILGNPKGRR